jgi:hypothetical protein
MRKNPAATCHNATRLGWRVMAVQILSQLRAGKLNSFAQHATTMFFPHFVGDACFASA